MWKSRIIVLITVTLFISFGIFGCSKKKASSANVANKEVASSAQQQINSKSKEKPVAPEKNPPGDIPDSQVFVKYASPQGHYEIEVPEGWSRNENGPNVTFINKLDGLSVTITNASKKPTKESIKNIQLVKLKQKERAVIVNSVKNAKLKNYNAIKVVYTSNSDPDPVTDKQVRLENNLYFFYKNGKLAKLRLWAPLGADNVDQWRRISDSFRWR